MTFESHSEYQVSKQSSISVAGDPQTEECKTFCQKSRVLEIQNLCQK